MTDSLKDRRSTLAVSFCAQLAEATYPCVGAKAAIRAHSVKLELYQMPDRGAAHYLMEDIVRFERGRGTSMDAVFASFVAVFDAWDPATEDMFQDGLFQLLQYIHDEDHASGSPWDASASADPANEHFGFSIKSRADFLVGMHPRSSRIARRFERPALVFNSHQQFAKLRETDAFEKMKVEIRARDKRLQGSHNPEMVGTKEVSEARQYSGRRNESDWRCPLIINTIPRSNEHD